MAVTITVSVQDDDNEQRFSQSFTVDKHDYYWFVKDAVQTNVITEVVKLQYLLNR